MLDLFFLFGCLVVVFCCLNLCFFLVHLASFPLLGEFLTGEEGWERWAAPAAGHSKGMCS